MTVCRYLSRAALTRLFEKNVIQIVSSQSSCKNAATVDVSTSCTRMLGSWSSTRLVKRTTLPPVQCTFATIAKTGETSQEKPKKNVKQVLSDSSSSRLNVKQSASDKSQPKYKFTYFNGRGRGELVRLMLAVAGQTFQDERLEMNQWPERKFGTPWGFLPVLEKDGKQLSQTVAIVNYLAHQYGLSGSEPWEFAVVESVVISMIELYNAVEFELMNRADDTQKEKFRKMFPVYLKNLENLVSQYGQKCHAVGSKLTAADIAIFHIVDLLENGKSPHLKLIANYPKVAAVVENVRREDKILTFINTRPDALF